jgi:hypothetical protein
VPAAIRAASRNGTMARSVTTAKTVIVGVGVAAMGCAFERAKGFGVDGLPYHVGCCEICGL